MKQADKRPVTIETVAAAAKVSMATASRVFNNRAAASGEVRERVLAAARALQYHPRIPAKQKNVVIITPYDSVYPVQSCVDMLLMALTAELPRRGFRIEILPINNLERLEHIQFCAAAAIGAETSDFPGWDERYAAPLIVIDRDAAKAAPGIHLVRSDEAQGMTLAIRHLRERGCARTGVIIHGEPGLGNASIRHEAVLRALKENGMPTDARLIHFSGTGTEKYVELIGKLLKLGVDSLFCPGGNAGILALYAFSLFNRRVPEDISLIASEQTFFSCYAVPPQTTISPDYRGIAEAAVDLIERIVTGHDAPARVVLPYNLIERESVRDLRSAKELMPE